KTRRAGVAGGAAAIPGMIVRHAGARTHAAGWITTGIRIVHADVPGFTLARSVIATHGLRAGGERHGAAPVGAGRRRTDVGAIRAEAASGAQLRAVCVGAAFGRHIWLADAGAVGIAVSGIAHIGRIVDALLAVGTTTAGDPAAALRLVVCDADTAAVGATV